MLTTYPKSGDPTDGAGAKPVWFDLQSPTEEEIAQVERRTGITLPRRASLSEIERSSRLQRRDGVLTMSTPTAAHHGRNAAGVAPLGFVLANDWVVTIRFNQLPAFDAIIDAIKDVDHLDGGGLEIFIRLCEEIVDHIADSLEHLAEELRNLSVATFHGDDGNPAHAIRSNRKLRAQIRHVGRLGDRLSESRDGLLGLGRILGFTEQFGCHSAEPEVKARLASVRQDLASLSDYDEHLSNKVQFVLDALVGLIGIAQNDIFKVLTIVSIVGIPPTLMAGIWGMNFKMMPELSWTYGYAYAWVVIVLSGVLPLGWFKLRGWF